MNPAHERGDRPALAMAETGLFTSQMKDLTELDAKTVWRSLQRARDGLVTPGVQKPWGGDWMLWPCGSYRVLLRPLNSEEASSLKPPADAGYLLYWVERSDS